MYKSFLKCTYLVVVIFMLCNNVIFGNNKTANISGEILLDYTWDSKIYLSYIPSYDKMYEMSNEMIIAEAELDNNGYFNFDLDFIPCSENLFRLHITKKGDSPATLIIGGKDENHLFLILDCFSDIEIKTSPANPPFKKVTLNNSEVNVAFQQISDLVFKSDSLAAESNAAKRELIEQKLYERLFHIADTSRNFLVSLYAIYRSKFESNFNSHSDFYKSYLKKWRKEDNKYFKSFESHVPGGSSNNSTLLYGIIITLLLFTIGSYIVKYRLNRNKGFQELTVQERKIFELLRQGSSNQDISNRFNIGLNTVKSHVSRIYSKLGVNSRKDIMNLNI